jgi:hypothetical protein
MSIYIIKPICECDEGDCYYGSTSQKYISNRMSAHRNLYNKYKNGTHHYTSVYYLFDKYGLENCKIELVEKLENCSREEILIKEGGYISNNICVNIKNPKPLSIEDYKDYHKNYYQTVVKTNPEKLEKKNETSKKWFNENKQGLINCCCGGTYTYKHKSRHEKSVEHKLGTDEEFKLKYEEEQKQKNEERKQRVKEYKSKWYQENK